MIVPSREACKWTDPAHVAENLIQSFGEEGLIWLDSDGSETGRWGILAVDPVEKICSRGFPSKDSASNPFDLLRNLQPGHWTGWLSYEAGAWLEPNNPWKEDEMAILWVARHDPVFKFDLIERKLWLEGSDKKRLKELSRWLKNIARRKEKEASPSNYLKSKKEIGIPIDSWQWLTNPTEFAEKINVIKNWIKQGDIFQANLSTCCLAQKPQNTIALELFQQLRQNCPAPFSGIIVAADEAMGEAVISTSPERFLKVLPNGKVETRPIKGTRPRKSDPRQDADMAADLVSSQKDRAENIMIVDLLRNDLGKVCKPGSIKVTQLVELESYSQVHHLTSVIKGDLEQGQTWVDLLEACWPGGSITGAPKLRACQRLHELEPIARGPYCGSFIHLDWDGTFDSNILIRSLMMSGSTLRINAGCGIVADSDAINEAEELTWKLIPLLKALE